MIFLAQNLPGMEYVPIILTCSAVGWVFGLLGIIGATVRHKQLTLFPSLVAGIAGVSVVFIHFRAHDFSLEVMIGSLSRNWPIILLLDMPLALSIIALGLFGLRKKRSGGQPHSR